MGRRAKEVELVSDKYLYETTVYRIMGSVVESESKITSFKHPKKIKKPIVWKKPYLKVTELLHEPESS